MKKVLTITFQRSLNCGAALQSYALVKFLNRQGYCAKNIDYLPVYFLWEVFRPAKGFSKTFHKIKKISKFSKFYKDFIPKTRMYFSVKKINSQNLSDVYICGSDQIWNSMLTGGRFDHAFFLSFAPESSTRISYAASSGSIRLSCPPEEISLLLKKFDRLGVREESLARDLKRLNNQVDPFVVADPSLILDVEDYIPLINGENIESDDFILSYVVGSGDMLTKFEKRIDEIKRLSGKKVIHIGAKSIRNSDLEVLDVGPREWLAYISKASHVITNSFHAVAFSIKFQKNFIFIPHTISNLNNRQDTLLGRVGLLDRKLVDEKLMSITSLDEIAYSLISIKLDEYIESSRKFLIDAING